MRWHGNEGLSTQRQWESLSGTESSDVLPRWLGRVWKALIRPLQSESAPYLSLPPPHPLQMPLSVPRPP